MPQLPAPTMPTWIEQAQTIRELIRNEDAVLASRIGWLGAQQAFLIAALGVTLGQGSGDLGACDWNAWVLRGAIHFARDTRRGKYDGRCPSAVGPLAAGQLRRPRGHRLPRGSLADGVAATVSGTANRVCVVLGSRARGARVAPAGLSVTLPTHAKPVLDR